MIPPRGFKAELHPLRHRFVYSAGLSLTGGTQNSTMFTLVKNYSASNIPSGLNVNPHNPTFVVETGAICNPMSIIDKLKLKLTFSMTELALQIDHLPAVRCSWTPIFFSFLEKLDAADEKTTTTVKSILSLTTGATEEDVTPAFGTKLPTGGASDLVHPTSAANFTEVFGTLNLTTNTGMEAVPHNDDTLFKALKYYTNKGALRACIGKRRNLVLTHAKPYKSYFIDKFVPRSVRRIVPYSFFAILIHLPLDSEADQSYYDNALATGQAHMGVKAIVSYDEWNADHHQDMDNP